MEDLRNARKQADDHFEAWCMDRDPEWHTQSNAAWSIERAFLKLLVAAEALRLESLKSLILTDIQEAKSGEGFAKSSIGPEGEPYATWLSRYSQHLSAIETLGPPDQMHSVTKELKEILRATIYSITDTDVFPAAPASEDDVHRRIEAVLKCVFPDLRRKPTLTKHIKNFEPDTGLPTIGTLIEYKFINRPEQVPLIADQILADTRGYTDKDWHTFLYVIYETRRIRAEHEWNLLLRDSGVPDNTSVLVLSGEPALKVARRKPARSPRRTKPARK